MVDFHNPAVIYSDLWALTKLHHAIGGLYFWEFFVNLDYEWSVIQGHRPYRWTIWVYCITRVATLMSVILNLVGINVTTEINCQLWTTSEFTFACLALVAASLLIVLRVIAIWNKNRVVTVISLGVWVINIACNILGIARLRAARVLEHRMCAILNIESSKLNIIAILITDVTLLFIMLFGLLRLRRYGAGTLGLGQLLWKQGVIWLFLATVAEVTPAVFVSLNLNEPFNLMFLIPSLVIMSIAATRMYRSLADFAAHESSDVSGICDRTVPKPKNTGASQEPVSLTPVEVAMHTVYEQYPASRMGRPSFLSMAG